VLQVAPETVHEPNCAGAEYYNNYYLKNVLAQHQFQPTTCKAIFPINNHQLTHFNPVNRIAFLSALGADLSRIWGYANKSDYKELQCFSEDPEHCFMPSLPKDTTPGFDIKIETGNIRLTMLQQLHGKVNIFVDIKEFCLVPLRTGPKNDNLTYNQDKYCDKVSVSIQDMLANLTATLESMREDRGMWIGDFQFMAEDVIKEDPSESIWPVGECHTFQPPIPTKLPSWVFAFATIGGMALLLGLLILQHRHRNRSSYVRLNEKLRTYT